MNCTDKIYKIANRVVHVGTSQIVSVPVMDGQQSVFLKKISGGTLYIGSTYSLVNGATTAFNETNAYKVGNTEILSFNSCGSYLLTAGGATVIAHVLTGLTDSK